MQPTSPIGFQPGSTAQVIATGQTVTILSTPWPYTPDSPALQHLSCWMVHVQRDGQRIPLACHQLAPVHAAPTPTPLAGVLAGLFGRLLAAQRQVGA